jgi:hypothetical protein
MSDCKRVHVLLVYDCKFWRDIANGRWQLYRI